MWLGGGGRGGEGGARHGYDFLTSLSSGQMRIREMMGRPIYLEAREKGGFLLGSFQQGDSHPETNLISRGCLEIGGRRAMEGCFPETCPSGG